jgi:hypothetical protein
MEVGLGGDPDADSNHESWISIGDDSGTDLPEDDTTTAANNPWVEFANAITFQTDTTLTVNDIQHAHAVDGSLTLIQAFTLAMNNMSRAHVLGETVLIQQHTLAVNNILHAHVLDTLNVTTSYLLSVNNISRGNALDNIDLIVGGALLTVQSLSHAKSIDAIILTQQQTLAINNILHAHVSDNLQVIADILLSIADLSHSHVLGEPVLTQVHILEVNDIVHEKQNGYVIFVRLGAPLSQYKTRMLTEIILTETHRFSSEDLFLDE